MPPKKKSTVAKSASKSPVASTKDETAKAKARAYMEKMKSSPSSVSPKKMGRRSRASATPELVAESSSDEEEEEIPVTQRGRSRSTALTTSRSKSPSTRGVKLNDTLAAVQSMNSAVAGITRKRKEHPTEEDKEMPKIRTPSHTPVSSSASVTPKRKVVTVNTALAMRNASVSPRRTEATSNPVPGSAAVTTAKSSLSPYAGSAGGASRSSSTERAKLIAKETLAKTPQNSFASNQRADSTERAKQKAKEILGYSRIVDVSPIPVERTNNDQSECFDDNDNDDVDVEFKQGSASHAIYSNLSGAAAYLDTAVILLIVAIPIALIYSSAVSSPRTTSTEISSQEGSSTWVYLLVLVGALCYAMVNFGISNFIMGFLMKPNSGTVQYQENEHENARHVAPGPVKHHHSTSPVRSNGGVTNRIDSRSKSPLRSTQSMRDSGPVSRTPIVKSFNANANAQQGQDFVENVTMFYSVFIENLFIAGIALDVCLILVAYLSYPRVICIYCSVMAVILTLALFLMKRNQKNSLRSNCVDALARAMKEKLKNERRQQGYPADFFKEDFKDMIRDKSWYREASACLQNMTISDLNDVWTDALRSLKADVRIQAKSENANGKNLEHLTYMDKFGSSTATTSSTSSFSFRNPPVSTSYNYSPKVLSPQPKVGGVSGSGSAYSGSGSGYSPLNTGTKPDSGLGFGSGKRF